MNAHSLSQSLTALLAAIVNFAIGWSVVLRERAQRPQRNFAALCFNLSLWQLASFLCGALVAHPLVSDVMYFASLFAAVVLPITSLRFFRSFLQEEPRRPPPPPPRVFLLLSIGFFFAIGYAIAFHSFALHHQRIFTVPLFAYVFFGLGYATWEMYALWRQTLGRDEKTRLSYLFVGSAAALSFAAADYLPSVGVPFPGLGNIAVTIYAYFLSQTLSRYRLLDLNELLGKMAVLSVFVLMLSAIYALLVFWIPSNQPSVFFFNTIVASLAIVILFEPLRSQIAGQVNKVMFREKYELRHRVEELRLSLANIIDVREAVRAVIASLEESRRVTHAAVYLVDQDGSGYELQGHLGPRPVERLDAAARRPFFERLTVKKGGAPVSLEQLEREQAAGRLPDDPANETPDAIARTLEEVNAGVCIPILAAEQLLGLLCLKDERLREAYATDEIDLFRGLAAQMAITLQNSKLYERMKERDRLAALGEMAAGLAHEIRNPLGAIKGAAQFLIPLPPGKDDPDGERDGAGQSFPPDAGEFLKIIVDEVNRLNKVVSQFLDYARPYRGELSPVDLNEVVRRSAQLITPEMRESARVDVQVALDESNPQVRADAEQLRQVFLNLALNAVQAMPSGGKLTISTGLRKSGRRGAPIHLVEARFRDTGMGIAANDMKNLFIPFFTTKEKGTGLGLPISQRIIENHGGTIEVRSRPGVGSTFTVVLPAAELDEEKAG